MSDCKCVTFYRKVRGGPSTEKHSCWSFDRKTYTWSSPKSSHSWNPWNRADFTMKLGDFTMKSVKSGRFHEIQRISPEIHPKPYKIRCFNKNSSVWEGAWRGAMTPDFMRSKVIAPLLHSSNWIVFVETSDFIRFGVDFTWNLPDFMWNRKTTCKEL